MWRKWLGIRPPLTDLEKAAHRGWWREQVLGTGWVIVLVYLVAFLVLAVALPLMILYLTGAVGGGGGGGGGVGGY
jgi:hypothetical protein